MQGRTRCSIEPEADSTVEHADDKISVTVSNSRPRRLAAQNTREIGLKNDDHVLNYVRDMLTYGLYLKEFNDSVTD